MHGVLHNHSMPCTLLPGNAHALVTAALPHGMVVVRV
jgi:hypothetical protein